MPRIIDNVQLTLERALEEVFVAPKEAYFCVGYFHIRGWSPVGRLVERLQGHGIARVLVGMHRPEEKQMRAYNSALNPIEYFDGPGAPRT